MIVAIHQPNYLPWLGYFFKMSQVDVFILLDTAQFSKNSYQNRVQIKTAQGVSWLTQPVSLSGKSFQETRSVQFANSDWREKHIKTIRANYARAPFFKTYSDDLFARLQVSDSNFSSYNTNLITWLKEVMGLRAKLCLASEYPSDLTGTERLVQLVKAVGGSAYFAGQGAASYQEDSLFSKADIRLVKSKFKPLPYRQLWNAEFAPGLSVIDALFNLGSDLPTLYRQD